MFGHPNSSGLWKPGDFTGPPWHDVIYLFMDLLGEKGGPVGRLAGSNCPHAWTVTGVAAIGEMRKIFVFVKFSLSNHVELCPPFTETKPGELLPSPVSENSKSTLHARVKYREW